MKYFYSTYSAWASDTEDSMEDWTPELARLVIVLGICASVMHFTEKLATRIFVNVLLRSFPLLAEKWCFVRAPAVRTRLRTAQLATQTLCGVIPLLMRWPGSRFLHLSLWECMWKTTQAYVYVQIGMVILLVSINWFIRIGHEMALKAGWVACPLSPTKDFEYFVDHAGNTPDRVFAQMHGPYWGESPGVRPVKRQVDPIIQGTSLSPGMGLSRRFFGGIIEIVKRNMGWLRTRNLLGSRAGLNLPAESSSRIGSMTGSVTDSRASVGQADETIESSLMGVSTELRRQFT